jgi:hypothetical protein
MSLETEECSYVEYDPHSDRDVVGRYADGVFDFENAPEADPGYQKSYETLRASLARRPAKRARKDVDESSVCEDKLSHFEMKIVESLKCPITLELPVDPVTAADGYFYERASVEKWLRNNNRSPMTNAVLGHRYLVPNVPIRNLIWDFVKSGRAPEAACANVSAHLEKIRYKNELIVISSEGDLEARCTLTLINIEESLKLSDQKEREKRMDSCKKMLQDGVAQGHPFSLFCLSNVVVQYRNVTQKPFVMMLLTESALLNFGPACLQLAHKFESDPVGQTHRYVEHDEQQKNRWIQKALLCEQPEFDVSHLARFKWIGNFKSWCANR